MDRRTDPVTFSRVREEFAGQAFLIWWEPEMWQCRIIETNEHVECRSLKALVKWARRHVGE